MDITVHVYLHDSSQPAFEKRVLEVLNTIATRVTAIQVQEIRMNADTQAALDKLNATVTEQTTVEASIETLLTGLSEQISALKNDQTDPAVIDAINAAAAIVSANNAKASAAVVANTPAA